MLGFSSSAVGRCVFVRVCLSVCVCMRVHVPEVTHVKQSLNNWLNKLYVLLSSFYIEHLPSIFVKIISA